MKNYILLIIFMFSFSYLFAQDCSMDTTGFIPIADLGKETFLGFMGGKYPEGKNEIPQEHFQAAMSVSQSIHPLNAEGKIDTVNGKIGMMVLGFSTAAMTGRFVRTMVDVKNENSSLEIIIGAQGGRDINSMIDINSDYWDAVDSAISEQGFIKNQVQLIWISSGDILNYKETFPEQSLLQIEKYRAMLSNIKSKYPNVKIVFISDRTYAGYIGEKGEGPVELREPTAYYNSWTVKWLIEKQILKIPGFTTDDLPLIDWGPLLWTDGTNGNANGYTWNCEDAAKGGIHPSSKGRMKEAALVYLYFLQHPYTKHLFK